MYLLINECSLDLLLGHYLQSSSSWKQQKQKYPLFPPKKTSFLMEASLLICKVPKICTLRSLLSLPVLWEWTQTSAWAWLLDFSWRVAFPDKFMRGREVLCNYFLFHFLFIFTGKNMHRLFMSNTDYKTSVQNLLTQEYTVE